MPVTFPHAYLSKPVSDDCKEKKHAVGRCWHWCCRRRVVPGRWECATCRSRLARLRNPDWYAYNTLRCSAYKRDIEFELSFEDFQEFVALTEYVERRGRDEGSLSIDRIYNDQPYRTGNLRIMDYGLNVSHKVEGLEAVTTEGESQF